jgi:CRISPR-associated endonuclease/helicase Cas3
MLGSPTTFWGKLRRADTGEVVEWHPLIAHSADVAAVCEALLTRTLLGARLAHVAGRVALDDATVARLCFLAALHDLGKLNHGFQAKALPLAAKVERRGHVGDALSLFNVQGRDGDLVALQRCLPLLDFAVWGGEEVTCRLLFAALGHHGRPGNVDAARFERDVWRRRGDRDPADGLARLVAAARAWFPRASFSRSVQLPAEPAFQHAFAGLVTLADWIGSDASTDAFRYQSEDDPHDRMPFARERAARVVATLGLDATAARNSLGEHAPAFQSVWPFAPCSAQQAVLDLDAQPGAGTLTLLESETGSGKTEAALAHYLRLFHAGRVDGLYFALPTRTAATQIHRRVVAAVEKAFPAETSRPAVVLAVPGYLRVDGVEGQRALTGFDVLWNDDRLRAERHRGWAAEHPKRYLAGAVVVGTIDQALLSTLQIDHAHLRSTALLRHLLVVDEVHASDAYGTRLLQDVLGAQLAAGGHALLLSATLGTAARARLFTPQNKPRLSPPPLAEAVLAPYPALVTRAETDAIPTSRVIEVPATSKRVTADVQPWADDPSSIVSAALEAARVGARVLILRNTVSDCVATQVALEAAAGDRERALLFQCGGVPAPHHARFARADRTALDVAIDEGFGKGRERSLGIVAVATQTVQQSLDLDADLLLTDLCPMDVLLQRIGRLHRHSTRLRPAGYGEPRVVVLVPAERDLGLLIRPKGEARGKHGFGTVYDDLRILEATWHLLGTEPVLEIPAMNRRLVELTTHPEALSEVVTKRGGAWLAHQIKVEGVNLADRGLAGLNVIRRDQPLGEVSACFPDKQVEDRRISTRLGEGDRRLVFEQPFKSALGNEVRELNVQAWLADGVASDGAATSRPEGDATIITSGTATFVYDRLGLRKGNS